MEVASIFGDGTPLCERVATLNVQSMSSAKLSHPQAMNEYLMPRRQAAWPLSIVAEDHWNVSDHNCTPLRVCAQLTVVQTMTLTTRIALVNHGCNHACYQSI